MSTNPSSESPKKNQTRRHRTPAQKAKKRANDRQRLRNLRSSISDSELIIRTVYLTQSQLTELDRYFSEKQWTAFSPLKSLQALSPGSPPKEERPVAQPSPGLLVQETPDVQKKKRVRSTKMTAAPSVQTTWDFLDLNAVIEAPATEGANHTSVRDTPSVVIAAPAEDANTTIHLVSAGADEGKASTEKFEPFPLEIESVSVGLISNIEAEVKAQEASDAK